MDKHRKTVKTAVPTTGQSHPTIEPEGYIPPTPQTIDQLTKDRLTYSYKNLTEVLRILKLTSRPKEVADMLEDARANIRYVLEEAHNA